MILVSQSPKFQSIQSIRSMPSCFRGTSLFETSAPNDSNMSMNTASSKVPRYPIYFLLVHTCPKFKCVLLYGEPFSSYRPFSDCTTNPKWPRPLQVQSYPVYVLRSGWTKSQILARFSLRWAIFQKNAIFEITVDGNVKFKFSITLVKIKIKNLHFYGDYHQETEKKLAAKLYCCIRGNIPMSYAKQNRRQK